MCKYCEMKAIGVVDGEYENDYHSIATVKDGHQLVDLYFRRYQTDDDYRTNRLIMDLAVTICPGQKYAIANTYVDIKYCPFCGEKL